MDSTTYNQIVGIRELSIGIQYPLFSTLSTGFLKLTENDIFEELSSKYAHVVAESSGVVLGLVLYKEIISLTTTIEMDLEPIFVNLSEDLLHLFR